MGEAPAVHVIDEVLPAAAVDAAYKTFRSAQIPMDAVFVDPSDPAARLLEVLPPPLALLLGRYLERIHSEAVALGYQPAAMLELWTNRAESLGHEVYLHVDNDEALRGSTGEVVPPEFGTILYLGPDGLAGGETLIGADEPSDEVAEVLFKHVPADRVQAAVGADATAVPPRPGRACIFRGSLAHCVLPFEAADGPRVNFLANGWVSPPHSAAR
jgi:hypothetical protein